MAYGDHDNEEEDKMIIPEYPKDIQNKVNPGVKIKGAGNLFIKNNKLAGQVSHVGRSVDLSKKNLEL